MEHLLVCARCGNFVATCSAVDGLAEPFPREPACELQSRGSRMEEICAHLASAPNCTEERQDQVLRDFEWIGSTDHHSTHYVGQMRSEQRFASGDVVSFKERFRIELDAMSPYFFAFRWPHDFLVHKIAFRDRIR